MRMPDKAVDFKCMHLVHCCRYKTDRQSLLPRTTKHMGPSTDRPNGLLQTPATYKHVDISKAQHCQHLYVQHKVGILSHGAAGSAN